MKHSIICLCAFAAFLGIGVAAHAQSNEISYSFVEARYQLADVSSSFGDIDADGPGVAASLKLGSHFHIFGDYDKLKLDNVTFDDGSGTPVAVSFSDVDTWGVGAGFHTSVFGGRTDGQYRNTHDRYSIFVQGKYISADPGDRDGWSADVGFRAVNFTRWEFLAAAGIEKLDTVDSEFTLEGRLLYQIVGDLQIEGGIDWNDNLTRYFLGLRYNFPGLNMW